ncbi:ABC transporter substrate-binding protein [Azospirillum sp. B4]|uniref:substrate-binding periplasmic protein n=1 Tax=Azospirillum sp. B4 TaxID=95605 RepID=UPI0003477BD9|nr:transporter substrate-binding domain-containing protein [Azospirillum sp. B4]
MGTIAGLIGRLLLSIIATGQPVLQGDAAEKPVIEFLFPDSGPFLQSVANGGAVRGPVAARVEALAAKAGVQINWLGPVPRNRILSDLQDGRVACTANAIQTPDRALRFKFTTPLFRDTRWVVVAKAGTTWLDSYPTLGALLADDTRLYGNLLGASVGSDIDRLVTQEAGHVRTIRGTPLDLIKMVAAGHVDYVILADDRDMAMVARAMDLSPDAFVYHRYPDLPGADAGRIMCAQTVPDDVIAAFNRALAETPR